MDGNGDPVTLAAELLVALLVEARFAEIELARRSIDAARSSEVPLAALAREPGRYGRGVLALASIVQSRNVGETGPRDRPRENRSEHEGERSACPHWSHPWL